MGVKLLSDTEDMRKKMIDMVSKCEELQLSLNETLMKIQDSKGYFDTPTSLYFRDSAVSYIIEQRGQISNDLVPFIEILVKVIDALDEEYETEKNMLGLLEGENK